MLLRNADTSGNLIVLQRLLHKFTKEVTISSIPKPSSDKINLHSELYLYIRGGRSTVARQSLPKIILQSAPKHNDEFPKV